MKDAIVAVEDKRFWTDPGVDIRGICARASSSDVTGGRDQGASTIAQQFVKNALAEQDNRTIFEKLREAALAFQLTHQWTKTKILTEYLNSIYFGNGAYGIESAARVYFGRNHGLRPARPRQRRPAAAATRRAPVLRVGAGALGVGAARRHGRQPERVRPDRASAGRAGPPRPGAAGHAASRATSARAVRAGHQRAAAHSRRHRAARRSRAAAPYFTSWLRPQIIAAIERTACPPRTPSTGPTTAG